VAQPYQEGIVWMLENVLKIAAYMLLSGLLMADYTQTTKDFNYFYDREIDVINEPYGPISSGTISVPQVVTQILVLLGVGLALEYALDIWAGYELLTMFSWTLGCALVAYIYSAPPFKLKQNSCLGNYALGASYIALPWWAGRSRFIWRLKLDNCDPNLVLEFCRFGHCRG
jgi:chlorophyll/bacteriochlorophyll a synthase